MCCVTKPIEPNNKPSEKISKKTKKTKNMGKKTNQKNQEDIESGPRKIIVYPEESDILTVLAKAKNIEVSFLEEDILPDMKNKKIIVPRYSIKPDEKNICPFLKNNQCSIYDQRPLSCRAYPIIIYGLESNNFSMDIDFSCQSLKDYSRLGKVFNNIDLNGIKKLFPIEFRAINQIFNREKQIFQTIRKMIDVNEIELQKEFSLQEFKIANEEWERNIIYTENI